jgi:uncharacterized protein YggU (UPF0235/DUF167 family)
MLVKVQVSPGARRESVREVSEHSFVISVKEPAERNQANTRVRELLAKRYGVRYEDVRFYTGVRGPRKVFRVVK